MTVRMPSTVASTTVASPLKVVLLAEALCAGQNSRLNRRLTVRTHEPFPFIPALALIEEPSFVVCFREKDPASPASTRKAHLRRPRAREGATHMPGAGQGSMRCKVASNRTLHEMGKEPSRRSAARSRHPVGPERQKILLPEVFMVPRSCDTRFNYEAEMFHLRMRRWSVER